MGSVDLTKRNAPVAVCDRKKSRAVSGLKRDCAGRGQVMDGLSRDEKPAYLWLVVVVVVSVDSVLVTAAGATVRLTTTLLTTGAPFSVV